MRNVMNICGRRRRASFASAHRHRTQQRLRHRMKAGDGAMSSPSSWRILPACLAEAARRRRLFPPPGDMRFGEHHRNHHSFVLGGWLWRLSRRMWRS
jgi:hypothetical protein